MVARRWKRYVICPVADHDWVKAPYPTGPDGERSGVFLRCRRCGREDHDAGSVGRGAGGGAGAF